MEFLCEQCDNFIIEKDSINKPDFDELDKLINAFTTNYDRNFQVYAIICEFF